MQRRELIHWIARGGVIVFAFGCRSSEVVIGDDEDDGADPQNDNIAPDAPPAVDPDACIGPTVKMHDTYAQALYFDGTKGPYTGTIRVLDVMVGETITFDFWHGHNNMFHRFTLTPEHFERLKHGEKITITTTVVDGHQHDLFIDPLDEAYRVPGAPDVEVPLGC